MEIKLDDINYNNRLKNISYVFKKSSITSIIGNKSSGKDFICSLIMGNINDYTGSIYIDSADNYNKSDYLKKVGYVSLDVDNKFIYDNVKDEISFGLKLCNCKSREIDKKVEEVLKKLNLSLTILNRNIMDLSSGEKILISLASALIKDSDVLIIDDITFCLDGIIKSNLVNLLLELKNKNNKTIIVLSNDTNFIYDLGNDYILMDRGEIVLSSSVSDWTVSEELFSKYGFKIPHILSFMNLVLSKKKIDLKKEKNIDKVVKEVKIGDG